MGFLQRVVGDLGGAIDGVAGGQFPLVNRHVHERMDARHIADRKNVRYTCAQVRADVDAGDRVKAHPRSLEFEPGDVRDAAERVEDLVGFDLPGEPVADVVHDLLAAPALGALDQRAAANVDPFATKVERKRIADVLVLAR